MARFNRNGDNAVDDDGLRFVDLGMGPDDFEPVEVAHILPHSLMSREGDEQIVRACCLGPSHYR